MPSDDGFDPLLITWLRDAQVDRDITDGLAYGARRPRLIDDFDNWV